MLKIFSAHAWSINWHSAKGRTTVETAQPFQVCLVSPFDGGRANSNRQWDFAVTAYGEKDPAARQ